MNKDSGFAIVTALGLLMILMIIIAVLSATSASEIKQGQLSIQTAQARAIADAGEEYASAAIKGPARDLLANILNPFIRQNINPESQWSIRRANWAGIAPQIEQMLNANFDNLDSQFLDSLGEANIQYRVSNFRGTGRFPEMQTYVADYEVISTGTTEKAVRRVKTKGIFEINVGFLPLARFLFLVDDAGGMNGFFPTGTIFNGPVHANRNWGFWGQPQFLDTISTAANDAVYWRGNCRRGSWRRRIAGDARPPCTVPLFARGFQRNVPPVNLPTNNIDQKKAALGLNPNLGGGQLTNAQICGQIGNPGTCPAAVPDGVYLINSPDPNNPAGNNIISGGIYVKGDLDELEMSGAGRNGIQSYHFRQGNKNYTITVDYNTNPPQTTLVGPPSNQAITFTGAPNGPIDQNSKATGQIYVDGGINDLRAPARTGAVNNAQDHPPSNNIPPALAKETQMNITAVDQIRLTSDIVYECDPTLVQNNAYRAQYPRCAIGANDILPTVLGMMSSTQDIQMSLAMPNDPYLWGSYLAGTSGKGLSVENATSRPFGGTMRLFGGLLQSMDQIRGRWRNGQPTNGFIETFDYDSRFANGLISPPNFPVDGAFAFRSATPNKLSYEEY